MVALQQLPRACNLPQVHGKGDGLTQRHTVSQRLAVRSENAGPPGIDGVLLQHVYNVCLCIHQMQVLINKVVKR